MCTLVAKVVVPFVTIRAVNRRLRELVELKLTLSRFVVTYSGFLGCNVAWRISCLVIHESSPRRTTGGDLVPKGVGV